MRKRSRERAKKGGGAASSKRALYYESLQQNNQLFKSVLYRSQLHLLGELALPLKRTVTDIVKQYVQILSLAIFAGGGWLLYVGEENGYDVITGSSIVSGAALLVLAGGITLIVSAVGMVGAFGMWRPVLFIVSTTRTVGVFIGVEYFASIALLCISDTAQPELPHMPQ